MSQLSHVDGGCGGGAANQACSICLEGISVTYPRTIVTLQCSHRFHLDCIGSAFNVSGVMQCPNCRNIENGEWRIFNEDSDMEALMDDLQAHHQIIPMENVEEHWCPCHGHNWVVSLPAGAVPNHHQEAAAVEQSMYRQPSTEISLSNRNHQIHYVPLCDHVTGATRPRDLISALEYANGVPYNAAADNHSVHHNFTLQPRSSIPPSYGMTSQQTRNLYCVPPHTQLSLNPQNNQRQRHIHSSGVNPAISSSVGSGSQYYIDPSNCQIYREFPDNADPWDFHR